MSVANTKVIHCNGVTPMGSDGNPGAQAKGALKLLPTMHRIILHLRMVPD